MGTSGVRTSGYIRLQGAQLGTSGCGGTAGSVLGVGTAGGCRAVGTQAAVGKGWGVLAEKGGVEHLWGSTAGAGAHLGWLGHSWQPPRHLRPMQVMALTAAASTAGAHLDGSRAGSYGPTSSTHGCCCAHLALHPPPGPGAQVTSAGSQKLRQLLRAWLYFPRDPPAVSGPCSFRLRLR